MSSSSPPPAPAGGSSLYSSLSIEKLKSEVASRRIEASGLSSQADLISALEAYDREQPLALSRACGACGAAAGLRCARCRSIAYCSAACQRSHWTSHKRTCVETCSAKTATASGAAPFDAGMWSQSAIDARAPFVSAFVAAAHAAPDVPFSPTMELRAIVLEGSDPTGARCRALCARGADPCAPAPNMMLTEAIKMAVRVSKNTSDKNQSQHSCLVANHATTLRCAAALNEFGALRAMLAVPGIDVDATSGAPDKYTALHAAIERRNYSVAKMLLDAGANPMAYITSGESAIELASLLGAPPLFRTPLGLPCSSIPTNGITGKALVTLLKRYVK